MIKSPINFQVRKLFPSAMGSDCQNMLLLPRKTIAEEFKNLHPTCSFSVSTLMREFPQNAVTPTTRNQECNAGLIHSNGKKLVNTINKTRSKKSKPIASIFEGLGLYENASFR